MSKRSGKTRFAKGCGLNGYAGSLKGTKSVANRGEPLQDMVQRLVESTGASYTSMINNFQTFYDVLTSNRAELAPRPEEGQGEMWLQSRRFFPLCL